MTRFVGTPLRGTDFNSPSDEAVSAKVNGDTHPRLRIDAGGRITWSTGSASGDTKLYRTNANTLFTEGIFSASGGLITLTTSGSPTAALPDGAMAVDTLAERFYFRVNGEWKQVSGGGAGITVSDTAPPLPSQGDLWYDSTIGTTYIRYDDFWLDLNGTETAVPGLGDLDNVNFGLPLNNDVVMYNASTSDWENTQITLGTNTVGSYVQSLVAGTGVSLTNNSGEGSTPTIAIGQAVSTSSSVTFATVTASTFTGNLNGKLVNARAISLSGDLSGSVAFDGSSDVTLNATVVNSGISLDEVSDVVLTSPLVNQSLVYNGTNWINQYAPVATYARNAEANALAVGEVVYLYGAAGDRASVRRASNLSDATSSKTVGVVEVGGASGSDVTIVTTGYVSGINLGAYTAGDVLWLGSTPGTFTTVKPSAPNHLVFIGVVARANSGNGILYVKCQNGYEIEELHDVKITSPVGGDFLKYDSSSAVWVNDQINLGTDTVGNYMVGVTAGTGVTVTHTPSEGSSATIAIGQSVATTASVTFARVTATEIYGRARDTEIRFLMEVF